MSATSAKYGRIRRLTCCCCGSNTTGRQWWNRDTGYGLCAGCITFCHADVPVGTQVDSYGIRGIHFDPTPEVPTEVELAESLVSP